MDDRLPVSRIVLFFSLLILGAAADLLTKWWVFEKYFDAERAANYEPQGVLWFIDGVFGIQTSTNPGALFGLGSGYSRLFAIFSVVALTGIVIWLFRFGAAFDRWLTVALGLVCGGIIGNCYDRLGFGAKPEYPEWVHDNVRDWILFRLEGVPMFDPWPNFNIADSLLVVGAAMLFVHSFVLYKHEQAENAEGADSDTDNNPDESKT